MPNLPVSAVAIAGTGGLGTGIAGWFLRQLVSGPYVDPANCQAAVDRAVEVTQSTCERVLSHSEAAFSEGVSSLLAEPNREKISLVLVGVCIGLLVFPLIDVLYILKSVWQDRVRAFLQPRVRVRPVPRPQYLPIG